MKPTKKINIAVICQKDEVWSLYGMNYLFLKKSIREKYNIKGFWSCNERLGKKETNIYKWYYDTFGMSNFIKLGLFFILFKTSSLLKSLYNNNYSSTFKHLCSSNNINYFETTSPNSENFHKWTLDEKIDIIIIMVGHILKPRIINAAKICIINKHASILPSNKGVFPYFWAYINNQKQGCTVHVVNEKIDDGEILYQEEITDPKITSSMVSFYYYVYKNYGNMIGNALNNITTLNEKYENNVVSSYNSFPSKENYNEFKSKRGYIIRYRDLLLTFKL